MPILDPSAGGVYQYSLTMIEGLARVIEGSGDELVVVVTNQDQLGQLTTREIASVLIQRAAPRRLARRILQRMPKGLASFVVRFRQEKAVRNYSSAGQPRFDKELHEQLKQRNIDLVFYPAPLELAFEAQVPFVAAIHDLQHRLQPEFPEVGERVQWDAREYLFRNITRAALLILADSEVGKEDILRFYSEEGITPDRVKVLPFLPASYLTPQVSLAEVEEVRKRYELSDDYFFYPAQFWPHKNHVRITEALGILRKRGIQPEIVFVGSSTEALRERTLREVTDAARRGGVAGQVVYLGQIPDEDMAPLYAGARALIMPTFFGPTNIPVLEAWSLGCPVLTSDIRGIREQVGDAAILADPTSIDSIAEGMAILWTDDAKRRHLIELGRRRLAEYGPDEYRIRLKAILEEAKLLLHKQATGANP